MPAPTTPRRSRSTNSFSLRLSLFPHTNSASLSRATFPPLSLSPRPSMLPHRWSRFLPSFTSSSPPPYGILALSASSPPSPELGNPNDKPFFRRGSTRLPFLLQLWLYVSPLIVLALCALLWGRKDLSKLDLLNPYVCKTKSLYSSLASICEDEPQRPGYGDEVGGVLVLGTGTS